MAGESEKNQADWFAEFKKVNKTGSSGKPDSTPTGTK